MKKRVLALLLTLVMLLSLLPTMALAEGETVTVQISNPSTYNMAAGAPFEGALDLNGDTAGTAATVSISAGDTAMDAIASALEAAGYTVDSTAAGGYNIAGGTYLDSVNGLTAGAASEGGFIAPDAWNYYWDGWCGVINDISPAVGFSSVYVSDGDVIRLEYSLDMTVSSSVYGSVITDGDGFTFSAGTLSSTGSAATYDLAFTLTLPASADSVQVTATPCTKTPVVVYDADGISHELNSDIAVSDGDTLQIVGGKYEEVFSVGINLIGADDVDTLLENIAAGYTASSGQWNVIDMSAYRAYNNSTESVTSAAAVQSLIDSAIGHAQAAKPNEGNVAKDIVALQSVGIDPDTLYPLGEAVSLFDALDKTTPASIYNVGYITLHAYRHGGTLTAERAAAMFDVIEASKNGEGKYVYTTVYSASYSASSIDTAAATLATVAPFAADEADAYGVKARAVVIRDAIIDELAAEAQSASGSFGNANSDAMVIIGLAAAGIDPHTDARFKADSGASLLDGLLSYALTDLSGFWYGTNTTVKNAAATEQGFRALVAAAQMRANSGVSGYSYDLYDFRNNTVAPGYGTAWTGCPLTVAASPADAVIELKLGDDVQTPVYGTTFDLAAGDYDYTVARSGYLTASGSIAVSQDEADASAPKTVTVSLSTPYIPPSTDITVYFTLMGDSVHGDGAHTAYETWISRTALSLDSGSTVGDAFKKALDAKGYTYAGLEAGYISGVTTPGGLTLAEKANGENSGWMYSVNGADAGVGLNDYKLKNGDEIIWFYEDDYTTRGTMDPGPVTPEKPAELPFTDVGEHWALDAIRYVYDKKLMQGDGGEFDPEGTLSRAMMVTILYRLEGEPKIAATNPFTDVPDGQWYTDAVIWAAENKLVDGYGGGLFGPLDNVTREQMAAMLYNYTLYKKYDAAKSNDLSSFADAGDISGWALVALKWANAEELVTGRTDTAIVPGGEAKRCEAATILMRYIENTVK